MQNKCVIVIEYETRKNLKDIAKKSQTYTDIINELIELKNNRENKN
jgi:hypothetical protein